MGEYADGIWLDCRCEGCGRVTRLVETTTVQARSGRISFRAWCGGCREQDATSIVRTRELERADGTLRRCPGTDCGHSLFAHRPGSPPRCEVPGCACGAAPAAVQGTPD